MAPITTICVVGFPAGVALRELKNLCRFTPGFVGAHVAADSRRGSTLFVRFLSVEFAQAAIEGITGAPFDPDLPGDPLKAEFARREMEVRQGPPAGGPPAWKPQYGGPVGGPSAGEEIVTVCVLGMQDKGFTLDELRQWFSHRPGYITSQANQRVDGIFVKFTASQLAQRAIADAAAEGLVVEWARRNLDEELAGGARAAWQQPQPVVHQQAYNANAGGIGDIVTVTVLGIQDKGLVLDDLQQWFQQRPGFVTSQVHTRVDGIFVKFDSKYAAEQAIGDAAAVGFVVEWARRNLDENLVGAAGPVVAHGDRGVYAGGPAAKRPRVAGGSDTNTITILGLGSKGLTQDDVQSWLQQQKGYITLKVNEKIDGVFAKFESHATAELALAEANTAMMGAEWARRNLE